MSWLITPSFTQWTPADITTALWLDAADASTITTVSGAVSQWNDKSGNNRNVEQSVAISRPLYQATGFNGLPAIAFDGTNDFLKNNTYQPAGAFTCVLVYRATSNGTLLLVQRATGIIEILNINATGYTPLTFTGTGSAAKGFTPLGGTLNQNFTLIVQYDGSGTTVSDYNARINGINQALTSSGPLGYGGEAGFALGGRPVQSNNFTNGTISEVLFFENVLTGSDNEKLEGYLAHKWGLTASLPADHPYKVNPPAP